MKPVNRRYYKFQEKKDIIKPLKSELVNTIKSLRRKVIIKPI